MHREDEDFIRHDAGSVLFKRLQTISEKCTECLSCVHECAFLDNYGTPKQIADRFFQSRVWPRLMPFECTLCGLCSAVCPVDLDPWAGCADILGRTSTLHVLDLLFEPEEALSGKVRIARPPFTYSNRLMLRRSLSRSAAEREG